MRVVAALGGNALLRRGEPLETEVQRGNVGRAMEALALTPGIQPGVAAVPRREPTSPA